MGWDWFKKIHIPIKIRYFKKQIPAYGVLALSLSFSLFLSFCPHFLSPLLSPPYTPPHVFLLFQFICVPSEPFPPKLEPFLVKVHLGCCRARPVCGLISPQHHLSWFRLNWKMDLTKGGFTWKEGVGEAAKAGPLPSGRKPAGPQVRAGFQIKGEKRPAPGCMGHHAWPCWWQGEGEPSTGGLWEGQITWEYSQHHRVNFSWLPDYSPGHSSIARGEKEQRTRSCLPASLYPRPLPSPLEKTSKLGWPANSVKLGTFHFCKVENSKSWLWIHRPCKPRAKVIWLQKPDFPILGVSPLNWMLERCCDTSKPLCYLSSSRKFIHLPKYSTCSPGVDGNCEYMLDLSHTHITYLCESHVIPSSTCAP